MEPEQTAQPRWLVVRLGDDMNWWVDESSCDIYWGEGGRGILDPRQVAHLLERWEEYRAHGCGRELVAAAFRGFTVESELSDGRLRLSLTGENVFESPGQLFALPVIDEERSGPFEDFIDALSAAHIRKLNATHHYFAECTELEMQEELSALDNDRYLAAECIHAFDQINEILEWSPAEWEDPLEPDSGKS